MRMNQLETPAKPSITGPDGQRFATYLEIAQRAEAAEAELARLRALLKQQGIDFSR